MKNLSLTIISLLIFTCAQAQIVEINEEIRPLKSDCFNSYMLELQDVSKKGAEEDWKTFMADYKARTK